MYIPEFVCGVVATIAFEMVAVIIAAVVKVRKDAQK